MSENALAAAELLDRNDPSLLTYAEVRDSYGTPLNFFLSFGLKPWKSEDCEEARAISRAFKEEMFEERREQDRERKSSQGKQGSRR